jgi:hypothetical protein
MWSPKGQKKMNAICVAFIFDYENQTIKEFETLFYLAAGGKDGVSFDIQAIICNPCISKVF